MWWLVALVQVAVPTAPALAPTGKWTIGYEDDFCSATRAYGVGDDQVAVGLRPVTWGNVADVVIVNPGLAGPAYRLGKGSVTPRGQAPITGRVRSWATGNKRARVIALEVPRSTLQSLAVARELSIDADGVRLNVRQDGSAAVANALARCEADLEATQDRLPATAGVADPPVTTPAGAPVGPRAARVLGSTAQWFSSDDYPADAVRLQLQGTSAIRWTITPAGRVGRCWVTARADHPALDALACRLIVERGRYAPATDANGKPIAGVSSRRIVWKLP